MARSVERKARERIVLANGFGSSASSERSLVPMER
ncbi:hypothetical protein ES703_13040 [subsurface metagenome]